MEDIFFDVVNEEYINSVFKAHELLKYKTVIKDKFKIKSFIVGDRLTYEKFNTLKKMSSDGVKINDDKFYKHHYNNKIKVPPFREIIKEVLCAEMIVYSDKTKEKVYFKHYKFFRNIKTKRLHYKFTTKLLYTFNKVTKKIYYFNDNGLRGKKNSNVRNEYSFIRESRVDGFNKKYILGDLVIDFLTKKYGAKRFSIYEALYDLGFKINNKNIDKFLMGEEVSSDDFYEYIINSYYLKKAILNNNMTDEHTQILNRYTNYKDIFLTALNTEENDRKQVKLHV